MPPIDPLASPSYVHDASKLQYVESRFKNDRGKSMFYCAFFPPATSQVPLRGVVLFLHGIGEHSHRFTHVYEHLCANNYGVIAYDMTAHGRSDCDVEGVRGHGEKFQHFVDDTNRFLSVAKENVIPRMLPASSHGGALPPLIFMGISFGCLVGLHTILSGVHQFHAAVLASPAISVEYTPILRIMSVLSKSLSWLIPTAKIVPGVNFAGTLRIARNTFTMLPLA
jgi:acylglycerol lipase